MTPLDASAEARRILGGSAADHARTIAAAGYPAPVLRAIATMLRDAASELVALCPGGAAREGWLDEIVALPEEPRKVDSCGVREAAWSAMSTSARRAVGLPAGIGAAYYGPKCIVCAACGAERGEDCR